MKPHVADALNEATADSEISATVANLRNDFMMVPSLCSGVII